MLELTDQGDGIARVQTFAYRAPRFAVTLPLQFIVQGATVGGLSRDLSDKGLSVCLDEPVLEGTQGRVRLIIESCSIEIAAQVAYAELREAGLRFEFRSEAERAFVQMLVKVFSRKLKKEEPEVQGGRHYAPLPPAP